MLAVWCFTVFAAVGERLAVSGKGERRAGDLLVSFASRVFFSPLCTCKCVGSILVVISARCNRGADRPIDSQLQ